MKLKLSVLCVAMLMAVTLFAQQIKVACVGNSVTYGMGIPEESERYPQRLQVMLGDKYDVRNFGNSGATLLKNGHKPYNALPEYTQALAFKPDVVIIHLGLNDTDPRNWPKFRDQFVRDYIALIDTFKAVNPKAEVKICRMTPIFTGHPRFKSSTREWYWQVQQRIESIAQIKQVELIDLHTPLHQRPDLFPDDLHPNGEGARILAETVYGAITRDFGGLRLDPIYSSGMVMQRHAPIVFRGKANGNTSVSVSFNGNTKTNKPQLNGEWQVAFDALPAGGPYKAVIKAGKEAITLTDILVGEVWMCSGQSNMVFMVKQGATAKTDIANANNPNIRLYNMQPIELTNDYAWSKESLQKVNALGYFAPTTWQVCSPETVADFSAVAYHFGKRIAEEENVPVGLILNAVGGSPTEAWISRLALEMHPDLVNMFSNWTTSDYAYKWCRDRGVSNMRNADNVAMQRHPYQPAYLYEASVAPFVHFNIAGVIWYQGESNEGNVELHDVLFQEMVSSWRKAWNKPLPFYYVQLSSMAVGRESWGHFRDSQRRLLAKLPHSGMAVSSDWGDSTDVHPRHKQPVGNRLALWALHDLYGKTEIVPSGPLFKSADYRDGSVYVAFDYDKGLTTSDNKPLRTFEVAEYPGLFYPAQATVEGNLIKVYSDSVPNPRYVRYGYNSFSDGNLVNEAGLPASTFTTE